MKIQGIFSVLLITIILVQGCKKEILLNPIIKSELIAFNEKVKDKKIKQYSVLTLNFYKQRDNEILAITLSNIYNSDEVQGLFFLDGIPVLLNFEDGDLNHDRLKIIMENADHGMLKTNLEEFIKVNQEMPQDSFDPPYVLFYIQEGELVKVN